MVAMSCVAPFETWPGIVLRTMSQVALKHMRMTSKKINMGILMGSNTPQPTIVWNILGKQKIICHHLSFGWVEKREYITQLFRDYHDPL